MKIPIIPFYKIERVVRMLPVIKEVFMTNSTENPKTVKLLEDALHNKKSEIFTLRQKIKDLEEDLDNTKWTLTKKQEELDGERR